MTDKTFYNNLVFVAAFVQRWTGTVYVTPSGTPHLSATGPGEIEAYYYHYTRAEHSFLRVLQGVGGAWPEQVPRPEQLTCAAPPDTRHRQVFLHVSFTQKTNGRLWLPNTF